MAIDIDEAKIERNELGLVLGWALATAAGLLAGFLPFALFSQDLPLLVVRIIIPLWAGLLVGIFQWLVLRRYLTHSVDWIINGGAGWALAFALGLVVIQILSGSALNVAIGYILFGAIIAVVQYPVLRREMPQILPWAIANILGWGLGAWLSTLIVGGMSPESANPVLTTAISALVTGLVAGLVTGAALMWIVRKPEY